MTLRFSPPARTGSPDDAAATNPAMSSDVIASRLEAIRLRFLARLREDYELVSRHREAGDLSAPDLAMIIHRMAGSAGLVGYPQISEVAGKLDNALADGTPDPHSLFEEVLAVLRVILFDAAK